MRPYHNQLQVDFKSPKQTFTGLYHPNGAKIMRVEVKETMGFFPARPEQEECYEEDE